MFKKLIMWYRTVFHNERVEMYDHVFLKALEDLGGRATNKAMRAATGLSDEDYARTKDALLKQGVVVRQRGRGGVVAFSGLIMPAIEPVVPETTELPSFLNRIV